MKLQHWMWLSLLLLVAGFTLIIWRVEVYGYPLLPDAEDVSWTVQTRIRIEPGEGPVKLTLKLPHKTPGLARLREDFISRGFGLDVQDKPEERSATWSIRRSNSSSTLYYRAQFYRDPENDDFAPVPAYPQVPQLEEPFATAMRSLADRAREKSADIASFASAIIAEINAAAPSEEISLFLNSPEYAGRKAEVAQTLLAAARIPSRQINGLLLVESERQAELTPWLAVHNEQRWLFFDPVSGDEMLPQNLLIWWLGDTPAVAVSGAEVTSLQWSVRRNLVTSLELAERRADEHDFGLAALSLKHLPLQVQSVYATLLLVPLGALVLVFMRNFIGLRAFGTFMPVLIALAFRETGLLSGLVLFALVIAVGLILRMYLERLRLLLVPRLAAMVTIVVMLMLLISLLSSALEWEVGLSIGLFPMVILAMVIERMTIVWEERGPGDAMIESAGSAVIAVLAFLVMGLDVVRHMVFVFPESLLIVLGLTIACGRYSGYRLTELIRFRELAAKS